MSIAHKCDRCGIYYNEYKTTENARILGIVGIAFREDRQEKVWSFWHDREIMFCTDCTDSLVEIVDKWFNSE